MKINFSISIDEEDARKLNILARLKEDTRNNLICRAVKELLRKEAKFGLKQANLKCETTRR